MTQTEEDDEERSAIPMQCAFCHDPMGALDLPRQYRRLGEWLEREGVNPLCPSCFTKLQHWANLKGKVQFN